MLEQPNQRSGKESESFEKMVDNRTKEDLEHHVAHQHYDMVAERETGTAALKGDNHTRVPIKR